MWRCEEEVEELGGRGDGELEELGGGGDGEVHTTAPIISRRHWLAGSHHQG